MIRPLKFRYNEETAANNYYQRILEGITPETLQERALEEFERFTNILTQDDINVHVVSDSPDPETPDSVFPNNWVSFHNNGKVGLYPMYAESRRYERRNDIISMLSENFIVEEVIDLSRYEKRGQYLEGTGSMVLDHENRIAYAALSERTHQTVLNEFCDIFNYKPVVFIANQTVNGERLPIYHTNVMMCLGDTFAVVCLDAIDDLDERNNIINTLERTRKEIVSISEDQVKTFAGNMLQVGDPSGNRFLVMSTAAFNSLDENQVSVLEKYNKLIHSPLDTIEACGGGSARCMMAEIFLPPRKKLNP